MTHNTHRIASTLAAVVACLALNTSTFALGLRNPDQNARATGQGEAFVAQADDASAIYYNPAGLTQVKGTQTTSGMQFNFPNITFHPVGGGEIKARDDVAMLPHFYAASDFGLQNWRFGIGFNVPYGNSITWGTGNQLSAAVDRSSMAVYNITPTVAYQINSQLSVGAGLNIYYGDILSRFSYLPTSSFLYPFFPNAKFEFRGDGLAVGATLGLLWKPNEHHAVGVVYRSPFTVNFNGTARVNNPPPAFILPDPGPSTANYQQEFPQSVAIGYAFRPVKKLKLEFDIEWTNWETLNTCALVSPNPSIATDARASIPYHWQDSFFYEFGLQYELNDTWTVRAGYIYSENTVPDATFNPNLPDSDRHVFSVGLGFTWKRLTIDAMYQYSRSTDRTITGSTAGMLDGQWSSDGHAVSVTSTLHF